METPTAFHIIPSVASDLASREGDLFPRAGYYRLRHPTLRLARDVCPVEAPLPISGEGRATAGVRAVRSRTDVPASAQSSGVGAGLRPAPRASHDHKRRSSERLMIHSSETYAKPWLSPSFATPPRPSGQCRSGPAIRGTSTAGLPCATSSRSAPAPSPVSGRAAAP
jgi:hypothetical protein